MNPINGFSKLTKLEKINLIVDNYFNGSSSYSDELKKFWHTDSGLQSTIDEFSENTLSNFYFPFSVVPNVLINNELFCVPMVIEESSVVAASARSANFWINRGGFKAEVISTKKIGQVHFNFDGNFKELEGFFNKNLNILIEETEHLVFNMKKRGGGILNISLADKTDLEENYYQLIVEFETCDAMGANFINSVLECMGRKLKELSLTDQTLTHNHSEIQIIMCILSNYTPECRVKALVECRVEELEDPSLGMSAALFVEKFQKAIKISKIDISRATTHNKGIMNGVDAVVVATGNDYRAVEACVHAYASRDGRYRGLSNVEVVDGVFKFSLEIPLAVGTVGGLTSLHPLAKYSLDLLGKPDANKLMMIIATIGLAQNFAAVRSLVTSGIQKGHMKMHLMNILNHLEACDNERELAKKHFENEVISFRSVRDFLSNIRDYQ